MGETNAAKLFIYAGARPNAPKLATLLRAFELEPLNRLAPSITKIYTGQHVDPDLGVGFADSLGINFDVELSPRIGRTDSERLASLVEVVGVHLSGSARPGAVIVIGDVNSSVAAGLVAARAGIPVVHLEAGLRSGTRDAEEVNRRILTSLTTYHLAPSRTAVDNLRVEGVPSDRIFFVGNSHTESLLRLRSEERQTGTHDRWQARQGGYVVLSVHKPGTLCASKWVADLFQALSSDTRDVICLMHPTLRKFLNSIDCNLLRLPGITYLEPVDLREMSSILRYAACVVTDSAGIQEECCVVRLPCIVVGSRTARPDVLGGQISYVGHEFGAFMERLVSLDSKSASNRPPFGWDLEVSARLGLALTSILSDLWVR